ncbi:MAG TPA: GNAT family N-acetyltransferase [Acidimicrobiales bacterium]|nr:GNAT family N-acetyltransferase [Acidimicrobiales bacterium]
MDRDTLLAAGDRNLAEVLRLAARTAPDGFVEDDGRLLLVSSSRRWPGPYHNGAIRLDSSMRPTDVLDRAREFFASRCSGYCIWIAAHADADLDAAAAGAGLALLSDKGTPRMAALDIDSSAEVPEGVSLDEVTNEKDREDFLGVTVEAYKEAPLPIDAARAQLSCIEALRGPRVRAVIARDHGVPVAAAMVVVSDGVAGVQMVGTIPSARRRGLAELCTRWVSDTGRELGATAVVLEASEAGEPVYKRMGFVEISRYRWYLGPPAMR